MTPVSRPNLIVDGKLDHEAITAELRRCIDTLLQKSRFQLSYEIRATGPAATKEFENPEIVVEFKGRDQDLLLQNHAELLLALEHLRVEIPGHGKLAVGRPQLGRRREGGHA